MRHTPHDFYHLPEYARICEASEGGAARALIIEDGRGHLMAPLILRPCAGSHVDAVSPYGYSAPLLSPSSDEAFVGEATVAFVEALRKMGVVSAFIRLHPVLASAVDPGVLGSHGTVVSFGSTVYIDLTEPFEELWRQTRVNHRRDIRRAENEGFTARADESWQCLGAFVECYRENMARVGAKEYYLFPESYFDALRGALGDRVHLLVVERQGRVAAAAIFTECSGLVQYHLGGTRDEFLPNAPMKLLFHFARLWFKERGARLLHLGGGVGAKEDSLFRFKQGFSSRRAQYSAWQVIPRPDIYDTLTRNWCARAGREPTGDYFPAYRQPR